MNDNVIKKIRDLLAKTGERGASEAEAATAMTMARKLMDKHHVTEEDLEHSPADDFAKVDAAEFGEYQSFVGKKIYAWESGLAGFVTRFVGVKAFCRGLQIVKRHGIVQLDDEGNPKEGRSFAFYGTAEDAFIAAEICDELRLLIASMAVARFGSIYKGDGAMYCEGFVAGLNEKYKADENEEERQAYRLGGEGTKEGSTALALIHRRTSLVAYKQEKASEWLAGRGIKLAAGSSRSGSRTGSASAFSSGKTDGRNANVSATRKRKLTSQ